MVIGVVVDNEFDDDVRVQNELKVIGSLGFQVEVLCLKYKSANRPDRVYDENIHINRILVSRKIKNILFALQNLFSLYQLFWKFHIKRFLKQYSIEVLHVHDLYMALPARQAIRNTDVTLVLDLHENYPEAIKGYKWANGRISSMVVRPSMWMKLEYKYLKSADWVVVLSESFKQELTTKYKSLNHDRFVVYPNVPDVDSLTHFPIKSDYISKDKKHIVFYFGAIAERRGIFTAISAIEILVKRGIDVMLLLVGPVDSSEKSRFKERITGEALKNHIQYYEWKDISEFPSMVYASKICISPLLKNKHHESGIANKVFQYMLFAKPVVVSDCGPQAQLVDEFHCGLVFKSGDCEDLADKLEKILFDNQLAKIMGENGRRCVMENFSIERCGDVLKDMYRKIGILES